MFEQRAPSADGQKGRAMLKEKRIDLFVSDAPHKKYRAKRSKMTFISRAKIGTDLVSAAIGREEFLGLVPKIYLRTKINSFIRQ